MRKLIFIPLAILLQFSVLAFMVCKKEYQYHFGKTVWLRTAPVDPRDIFRGDFVRLRYNISQSKGPKDAFHFDYDSVAYLPLKKEGDVWGAAGPVSAKKPAEGVFIRGRTGYSSWGAEYGTVDLTYGIEKYFVQQGHGRDIEKKTGRFGGIHIPLEMEIALGSSGSAMIKGHRWCKLGIELQVTERPPRRTNSLAERNSSRTPPPSPMKVKLTLMNASDAPLALVLLPDNGSFNLVPIRDCRTEWKLANPVERSAPTDDCVVELKPNEKREFVFDMLTPRWQIRGDGKTIMVTQTEHWMDRFRIVYQPPTEEECRLLKKKDLIWHGRLRSSAFSGSGNVD